MSRQHYARCKQVVVAATLALGAISSALADDSSMNPFAGDSYKYFNGGHTLGQAARFNGAVFSNAPVDSSWRQSHPNGLTERELQALSSSGLAASASQLDPLVFASAPADTSWRQSHPNGLTERELQALSSSTLASWQVPSAPKSTASASTDQAYVAQNPSEETFSVRLARFFHGESGTPVGANQ